MKKITFLSFLLVSALILSTSCKRKAITEDAQEVTADEALASSLFEDISGYADQGHQSTTSTTKSTADYIVYDEDTAKIELEWPNGTWKFPCIVTLDFGNGSTDKNGVTRKGKVKLEVNGTYGEQGSVRTLSFENYFVNEYQLQGTKTVTNSGKNANDQTYFSIKVANAIVTTPDGEKITWESNRIRTWVEGEKTQGWFGIFDDAYEITGTSSGTGINGNSFTSTIKDPLCIQVGCNNINKGSLDIVVEDNPPVSIDYGDGTCDKKATVKYKNREKEITLKR